MDPHLLLKAIGFFLLVIIGIPGNIFLLLQFAYIKIYEKKLLPTYIILTVLAMANFLIILSRIIPQFLNSIGVEDLLNDTECKFVIYTYRVNRATSICVTSLLSCHQCILISPTSRAWICLKKNVTQNVGFIIIIVWIMNLSMYPYSILNARARKNISSSPYALHLVYCDADFLTYTAYIVNGTFYAVRDFIFVGLMLLASSYMVYILLQHKRNMTGIRNSERGQRRSAENKASRSVILLVVLYVVLFGLDNSMWIYTLTLSNVNPDMNDIRIFLASSYAALSPIVIIITNPKLQYIWNNQYRSRLFQKNTGSSGLVISISK
ncbi:olfactory receptor class A-like protein 1 [Pseudophryne corroboree]|uniref:olfactory receptor class A-like protein 1 n=1 Tax=Pseudophryne corroboree TaxID=495146 RepID=UPI0030814A7A